MLKKTVFAGNPSFIFITLTLHAIVLGAPSYADRVWECDMFPVEHRVTSDETSQAKVVFVTSAENHDTNFYFHQRSWLADSSVLFFKRSFVDHWELFGYIERTGELFRVQKPEHHIQAEPTASNAANSLYVVHGNVLSEWTVSVSIPSPNRVRSEVRVREREVALLPTDGAGLSGISESSDGKGVIVGFFQEVSPRSRIVWVDRESGELKEIMATEDVIYHVQASWETAGLVMFSRVYAGTDDRAPLDFPDGSYSRLHAADLSEREPWPLYPQEAGELVTHENWWVNDQVTFFGGLQKEGNSEEAHMKVLDTRTGMTRILGAGAWWPGGTPMEVSNRNWWHGSGAPTGRFAAADNWHGKIGIFSAKTARTRILARGHRTYGKGEHPHPGWDPTGSKVVFTSNRYGNADVCIGYLPEKWLKTDW